MFMANTAAILTDAFPANKRGMALGVNQVAGISGQFVGLLLGGLLAPVGLAAGVLDQRAVRPLRHRLGLHQPAHAVTRKARIDWVGNIVFAVGRDRC